MPVVDVHSHFYPPAYLDALTSERTNVRMTFDADGNPLLHYPGDYNIVVPAHRDIEHRARVVAGQGVDRQILSLTTPGTHIEEPGRAVELARIVNDAFAELNAVPAGRFRAFATLPLNDPEASAMELERALTHLGLAGAMLFSNVNGEGLAERRFWPIYEAADGLGAVLYIHPTHPLGVEAMTEYWLMPLVGFPFDTTLAAARLVFAGVPERFPRIRWILSHLGGAIPYLAERLDRGFRAFEECRRYISRPPSDYLKTEFYYDTVNFDIGALRLALDFAGPDHVLAGSDFPHQIGSIPSMISSIRGLGLSQAQSAAILGGNATRLLGLS